MDPPPPGHDVSHSGGNARVEKRGSRFMLAFLQRLRFARALRHRPFALLWLGQTISALGDGAYYVALAWLILLTTGSATALGVVVIANAIPRLVFLLIGGVAADRFSR